MSSSVKEAVATESHPSRYQLDVGQTLKASTALLHHVRTEAKRLNETSINKSKRNLLADEDGDSEADESLAVSSPIWLHLTTKKHLVDKNRLKPGKIPAPHSIYQFPSLSICLITTDPQRAVKDVVADPSFPQSLSSKIGRIISFSKLQKKYHSYEARRQLLGEHDVFLADERIITRLVQTLGKIFYKETAKRPIPIRIARIEKVDGKRVKRQTPSSRNPSSADRDRHSATVAEPHIVAKEIESTLHAIPISLRPGTAAAVRVGRASFSPDQLSENITVVAAAMINRYVVQGWRNVKAIHIKSPNSAALPIWLADGLWVGDEDVIEDEEGIERRKREEDAKEERMANKKKRKAERNERKTQPDEEQEAGGNQQGEQGQQQPLPNKKPKKDKKDKPNTTSKPTNGSTTTEANLLDTARKAKLAQQKARALKASA